MSEKCPFCGRDPFHYVDIGVGWEPVAVICCEAGIEHYEKQRREAERFAPSPAGEQLNGER